MRSVRRVDASMGRAWLGTSKMPARILPQHVPCTARHCHVKVRVKSSHGSLIGPLVWRQPDSRIDGQSAVNHLID